MKIAFMVSLFFFALTSSFAGTWDVYKKSPRSEKIKLLIEAKIFLKEVEQITEVEEFYGISKFQQWKNTLQRFLLDEAHAAPAYKCFYAGWPSILSTTTVNGQTKKYCASPAKKNELYKTKFSDTCASGEMLCNPVLFGEKLCITIKTQAERNNAFVRCDDKATAENRTVESILAANKMNGLEDEFKSLFDLIDSLCKNGFQSSSKMCRKMEEKSKNLIENNVTTSSQNEPSTTKNSEENKEVTVLNDGAVVDGHQKDQIMNVVVQVDNTNQTEEILPKMVKDCSEIKTPVIVDSEILSKEENSEPVDQNAILPNDYCINGQTDLMPEGNTSVGKYSDDAGGSLDILYRHKTPAPNTYPDYREIGTVVGFSVRGGKLGPDKPQVEDGITYSIEEYGGTYPKRYYDYKFEGRSHQSDFTVADFPVTEEYNSQGKVKQRYGSTEIRLTHYTFFPRKVVPSIKKREDKLLMTMSTGEQMVLDAKTGKVIDGVGKEVPGKKPVETRTGKKRFYPPTDFVYQGQGLWIESVTGDTDTRRPGNIIPVKANVDGKIQECKMKSEDLWSLSVGSHLKPDQAGYLNSYYTCFQNKFKTDKEFYEMIHKQCPEFKFPALTEF